jgi:hypothetical protein
LSALGCDIVWATTWMQDANDCLAPWLGWDPLPMVDAAEDDPPADGVHWKTPAVVAYAAGRPFVWLDDEITQTDEEWASLHHPAFAYLVRIDPTEGLTEEILWRVERWLGHGFGAAVDDKLVGRLLAAQEAEFQNEGDDTNWLLVDTVCSAPRLALLETGLRELRSEDQSRRILGTRLVREIRDDPAVSDALTSALRAETDREVVGWILAAFGVIGSDTVTDLVLPYADHPDAWVRYYATEALSHCKVLDPRSSAALMRLGDEDDDVRFSAVFELGVWLREIGGPQIRAAVEQAVDDPNETVARVAREALAEFSDDGPGRPA